MLTELKLSNFRIFDDEITVNFRPITILIGKNNAGKSSIIKFLLMLRQSINTPGGPLLVTRGEHVKLGKFFDLKNTRSRKTKLKFCLSMEGEDSPGDVLGTYLRRRAIDPHTDKPEYQIAADVKYNKLGTFLGNEWGLILSAKGKKILTSLSAITENSKFLDFVSEHQGRAKTTEVEKTEINLVVQHCFELIGQNIKAIDHIAPTKIGISRSVDVGEDRPINYVGQNGEHTLYQLYRLWEQRHDSKVQKDRYDFVSKHLEKVLDVGAIDFLELGDMVQCNAANVTTGACTNMANFGFGVSQSLPILVQGAMMYSRSTLMIEQPEAQVHPTAQLDLGGFLASLWCERGVGSIIETHSSNILLRLRRLIAKNELAAKDVSVVFFDTQDGKPVVHNLKINEDGSFQEGLPMEFFHREIWEAMDMGVGK